MQRLKKRSQFQAVLAGSRIAATKHFMLHRRALDDMVAQVPTKPAVAGSAVGHPSTAANVWLGAMVPKRWAKHAVTRNSIKRQIFQVSSEFESVLPFAAHVVRLRSAFDRASFFSATSVALKLAVREELRQLFAIATRGGLLDGRSSNPPRC